MKIFSYCIIALALLASTAAIAQDNQNQDLVGHFKILDRDVPGCGIFFIGSVANFVVEDSQSEISLVITCIEMQAVKAQSGRASRIELGRTSRIVATSARPKNLSAPAPSPKLLYLVEIKERAQPAV